MEFLCSVRQCIFQVVAVSNISNFLWERPAEGLALFSQLVDASVFPAPLLLVGCCTCLGVFPRVGAMVGVVSVGDVACFIFLSPFPFSFSFYLCCLSVLESFFFTFYFPGTVQ